jgi:LPXTG-site transpeptidase (sortase) family protein
VATTDAFPSLLPLRGDPVWDVVGPASGAVTARPVDPGTLEAGPGPSQGKSTPWLPLAGILLVAVLVVGGLVLIGLTLVGALSHGNQLPGSPGFAGWPLVAIVVVAGALVWGARAYSNRGASSDNQGRARGWRWLTDSRVIGSALALLFLLAAVLVVNTPGYSSDIRELPGEVNGLIQQAVAQKEQGYPRIRISRVGIDLLLVKGDGKTPPVKYEAFTYPNADHLLADQGTPGNTYVYAHARTGMFWSLHDLNIGDPIEVDYGGGKVAHYRVSEIHKSVNWKDFKWLQPTSDDRLTLQTCNGWRDDDPRFIVVAHRVPDNSSALAQ